MYKIVKRQVIVTETWIVKAGTATEAKEKIKGCDGDAYHIHWNDEIDWANEGKFKCQVENLDIDPNDRNVSKAIREIESQYECQVETPKKTKKRRKKRSSGLTTAGDNGTLDALALVNELENK